MILLSIFGIPLALVLALAIAAKRLTDKSIDHHLQEIHPALVLRRLEFEPSIETSVLPSGTPSNDLMTLDLANRSMSIVLNKARGLLHAEVLIRPYRIRIMCITRNRIPLMTHFALGISDESNIHLLGVSERVPAPSGKGLFTHYLFSAADDLRGKVAWTNTIPNGKTEEDREHALALLDFILGLAMNAIKNAPHSPDHPSS